MEHLKKTYRHHQAKVYLKSFETKYSNRGLVFTCLVKGLVGQTVNTGPWIDRVLGLLFHLSKDMFIQTWSERVSLRRVSCTGWDLAGLQSCLSPADSPVGT